MTLVVYTSGLRCLGSRTGSLRNIHRLVTIIAAKVKEPCCPMKKKKINPFDTAYQQYLSLAEKAQSTIDIQEKNLIFRRRINLLGVMQFLLTQPRASS